MTDPIPAAADEVARLRDRVAVLERGVAVLLEQRAHFAQLSGALGKAQLEEIERAEAEAPRGE